MRAALSLTKGNIELLEEVASGCVLLLPHVPAKFMNFDIYISLIIVMNAAFSNLSKVIVEHAKRPSHCPPPHNQDPP